MTAHLPLVERKRRRARQRILSAADELFRTRGFDHVSVSDIAERAEVGRTTFFRYFGDKQEVVFAKQQELLDAIAAARDDDAAAPAPRTAAEALEQLRPIVLDLFAQVTADRAAYARHHELLDQHPELRARDALKTRQLADRLCALLVHRGCEEGRARFAAEIALACCQTPRHLDNDPATLVDQTRAAFDQALALGAKRRIPNARAAG